MSAFRARPASKSSIDPTAWMVTFSDMLQLMLTFFVLLFSMASLDALKLRTMLGIFPDAIGVLEAGRHADIARTELVKPIGFIPNIRFKPKAEVVVPGTTDGPVFELNWKKLMSENIDLLALGRHFQLREKDGKTLVSLDEKLLEKPTGNARSVLASFGEVMNDNNLLATIEGYSSATTVEADDWTAAVEQAARVAEIMIAEGKADPAAICIRAYHRPKTVGDRSENRRIEILFSDRPRRESR